MNTARTRGLMPPWQPGQSGNPSGKGRKLSPELLAIKAMFPQELARMIAKYGRMERCDIRKALADETLNGNESCIAAFFIKAIDNGCWASYMFLLDRAIGKAPVVIEEEDAREELQSLSDEELLKLAMETLQVKKAG